MEKVTTIEAAAIGECSDAYIRQLVAKKILIPLGKIGQVYVFQRSAIVRYFAKPKSNGKKGKK